MTNFNWFAAKNYPKTNQWSFGENCSAVGGGWKTQFFLSWPFWIFIFEKKKFASSQFKLVIVYGIPRMEQNFDDYPGFQLKVTHAN